MTDAAVVLPARWGSTRFPGKPMALIRGVPLIVRMVELARSAKGISRVVVATDDDRIAEAAAKAGAKVVRPEGTFATGSDRVAHVARSLSEAFVVNLQADELFADASPIEQLVERFRSEARAPMGTLKTPIRSAEELADVNVVKVVTDRDGYALYFSRSPIPALRRGIDEISVGKDYFKHLGVYIFRRDFLLRYSSLPPSRLEALEKLEQLRALEAGTPIRVFETVVPSLRVDIPDDILKGDLSHD